MMMGPEPTLEMLSRVQKYRLGSDVEFLVDPSDAEVRKQYRESDLLLFPSLYEGFGWPPLEAMAAGCLVVCSNRGALPEVAGPSLMAAPDNIEQLAKHSVRLLTDEEFAKGIQEKGIEFVKGFSIERFATALAGFYRRSAGTSVPRLT
jgi:glycosyltransferase involved in cell wall biosynthesis